MDKSRSMYLATPAALVLIPLTVYLGYIVKRTDFYQYLAAYGAFFLIYAVLVFTRKGYEAGSLRFYLGLGILLRFLLLFCIPNLSDDVFRFLWDGRLIANGIHPFAHPPLYFFENQYFPEGLTPELFSKLNSPQYYTVYPPLCQAVFALAAWISPRSIWGGIVVVKIFLFLCEIGILSLLAGGSPHRLSRFLKPGKSDARISPTVLLYALNPLIILEITGNCHFEGAAIFFILAGLYFLNKTNLADGAGEGRLNFFPAILSRRPLVTAAACFALAVASKLTPLIFMPAIWRWLGWKRGFHFMLIFGATNLVLFLPLFNAQILANMAASLDLYFQKFAFNASIYYAFWEVGLYFKNYNLVNELGPALAPLQLALMGWIAWRVKPGNNAGRLQEAFFWTICVYLFFASTVHPWYLALPFVLNLTLFGAKNGHISGVQTHFRRFPLVWSALAALSYSHYHENAFLEQKNLIALEYALVGAIMLFETIRPLR